jgi:solute carrier family 45 protein 1/2/4
MLSHILFAICMLLTIVVTSFTGIFVLVGLSGISWAITIWAPFAIIGAEISDGLVENPLLGRYERRQGIVMGLHNVAIASPQVVAAVGSTIIFWMLDGMDHGPQDSSIGWVLRLSALPALVAAVLTRRVRDAVSRLE